MGGVNIHVKIHFGDGVTWLARIRRTNIASPPPAVRDYTIRSEVATLRFLENISVPSPRCLGYALEGAKGNDVGVGYMIMEEMPGKPLQWVTMTDDQKRKIIDQLADIAIEFRKHPMPQVGSLDQPEEKHLGPIAKEDFAEMDQGELRMFGPFADMEEYFISYLEFNIKLILQKELYHQQPIDAFLVHRFLLDTVAQVWAKQSDTTCYLKHADDKGNHILIDDDYNITGIIDWESAYTANTSMAFRTPRMLLDVAEFFKGSTLLSADETYFAECLEKKGAEDLASCVRLSRARHFFEYCCAFMWEADFDALVGLFKGLRSCVGVDADLDWHEWRQKALQTYSGDERLTALLLMEEE